MSTELNINGIEGSDDTSGAKRITLSYRFVHLLVESTCFRLRIYSCIFNLSGIIKDNQITTISTTATTATTTTNTQQQQQ